MKKFLISHGHTNVDSEAYLLNYFQGAQSAHFQNLGNELYGLKLRYMDNFLSIKCANCLLIFCEKNVEYFTGDLGKVKILGKWHAIPRKQVAFGDPGLSYHFSGTTVPARSWIPVLESLKTWVNVVLQCEFNFVLINR